MNNVKDKIKAFISNYRVENHKQAKIETKNLIQRYFKEIKSFEAIGIIFAQNKKTEDAITIFKTILNKYPESIDTLINIGLAFYELNKLNKALVYLEKAKSLNKKQSIVHFCFGLVYEKSQDLAKALSNYKQSIKYNSNNTDALINSGNIHLKNKDYQKAKTAYEQAINLKPNDPNLFHNLGIVFTRLDKTERAIELYSKAKELNSKNPLTYYNLGNLFAKNSKNNESINNYKKAIKLYPNNAKFYYNLALAELEIGKYYSAITNYKKALTILNDYTSAKYNLARLNLATENFSEGWHNFEERHNQGIVSQRVKNILKLKKWNGKKLDGTLFVHGEQGVGDLILHSSIISDLHKIQSDICLTVDERMLGLFQRSFKDINVKSYDSNLDYTDNDNHIPLASLGSFLRQSINDFSKQPKAYILSDPKKTNHFTKILSHNNKIKIGLSWRTTGDRKLERTISLKQMSKFLTLTDVEFINLQYGDTSEERKQFKANYGIDLINFDDLDLMNDFEGLAALVASCDLVITISNITAHISGALGKKTWVIVPLHTQWHWFNQRKNSLWYPDVTLFRQTEYRKWKDVIDTIYNEILDITNN